MKIGIACMRPPFGDEGSWEERYEEQLARMVGLVRMNLTETEQVYLVFDGYTGFGVFWDTTSSWVTVDYFCKLLQRTLAALTLQVAKATGKTITVVAGFVGVPGLQVLGDNLDLRSFTMFFSASPSNDVATVHMEACKASTRIQPNPSVKFAPRVDDVLDERQYWRWCEDQIAAVSPNNSMVRIGSEGATTKEGSILITTGVMAWMGLEEIPGVWRVHVVNAADSNDWVVVHNLRENRFDTESLVGHSQFYLLDV